MDEFLRSMTWPFLACLVLTGIHVYLGIHVISRKVIFVDLALAQIAALGSVVGVLLGWDLHEDPWHVKGFSLAFTILGAGVFSMTRMRSERVPHEAMIGIAYAVALAATILASAHLAHGAEEVSELLAGSILWVRPSLVGFSAVLYAVVGLVHWVFRKQFFEISLRPEAAEARGMSIRAWDFLFYVTFGFVVTSSVSIAGVLLVFSFLVIPAVIAMLFAETIRGRLAIGWVLGTLVSAIGCSISYFGDLPSGPTIVVCFGTALVLAGAAHAVRVAPRPAATLVRLAAGGAALVALGLGARGLRKDEHPQIAHLLEAGSPAERVLVLHSAARDDEVWRQVVAQAPRLLASGQPEIIELLLSIAGKRVERSLVPEVANLLDSEDDLTREDAIGCLRRIGGREARDALAGALEREQDPFLRVEIAHALLELGDARGAPALIDTLSGSGPAQARREAWEHLRTHYPGEIEIEFDPAAPRPEALARLRRWWQDQGQYATPFPTGEDG